MLAAMRREPHDHVPFSPYICSGPYWQEPLHWRNQIERAEKMLALGLDPTIDIWLPDVCPAPEVTSKTTRERKGREVLLTKAYHTPAGVLRQVVRETEDWCSPEHGPWIPTTLGIEALDYYRVHLFDDWCVSRRVEPWVKGPEDLDKLRYLIRVPEGEALNEWRIDAERAIEFAQKRDLMVMVRRTIVGDAFEWFCDLRWFALQLTDDPEFIASFLGIFQEWAMRQLELVLDLCVDVVQYRGWYEIPSLWGRRHWAHYLIPLIEEQAKLVHDAGKLFSLLLPEGQGVFSGLLKGMNLDVLQGVDPRMLHVGTVESLFAELGDSKSFWGGVNAEVTLASGDPQEIDEAARQAIEVLGGNHGLILSAFLFTSVPQPAVMAMIDAWRKYRDVEGSR